MDLIKDTEVRSAYQLLKDSVNHTPLQYDRYLSEKYQATILLKREDLQKVRSFKLRGAYYAIKKLSETELKKVWFVRVPEIMHRELHIPVMN